MKRIAVFTFVILLLLLTVSCASAPYWSGTETEAGQFVWKQSPGIRFYVNVLILGGFLGLFVYGFIFKKPKEKSELGFEHIGCLALIFLFSGFMLWKNIQQNIWTESFSINSDQVEITYYPTIGETGKQIVEWKNVASCAYFSGQFDTVKWRMTVGGTTWEEGETRRGITLFDRNKNGATLLVEKDAFNTDFRAFFYEWVFGSNDFTFSPEEEMRLKKAINKYLPENVKQQMEPETKEYMTK